MEIILVNLNESTLEITLDKIWDIYDEYKDKEILYDGENVCIVCKNNSMPALSEYKRLLIKAALNETIKELNQTYEELANLNKKYIGLVDKLI